MASPPAPRVVRLQETGSTNKDAMRLALSGEPLPLWVVAERQTAGRGRSGRSWNSLSGNLHGSVAFSTAAPPQAAGQLALLAGLMLHEAVSALMPAVAIPAIRLKWPNDLMIGAAKAGGILVESLVSRDATGLTAVIGFGVNIVAAPELDRPVTSLARHGGTLNAESLLNALAGRFDTWLDVWDTGRGFATVRAAWLSRGGQIGEAISINTGAGAVSGTYQGLSETGALLIEVAGRLETFNFGDVALATGARTGE